MRLPSLLSLALVVQLLSPAIGRAGVEFLCEMDKTVHRSCCCEQGVRGARPCAEVGAPDCCTLRPGADRQATRSDAASSVAPVLTEVAGAPRFALGEVGRRCSSGGPGGSHGPPIFLRNCTLLR